MSTITPGQIRAARALIDCSRNRLADAAGVSVATVKLLEDGSRPVSDDAGQRIRDALETEGVHFLPDEGDGPGVRFEQRSPSRRASS